MKVNNEFIKKTFEPSSREAKLQMAYKHNIMASLFLRSGNSSKAEFHYLKAIEEAKSAEMPYSNLFVNLGNLYSQLKKYGLAEESYSLAIKTSPWNAMLGQPIKKLKPTIKEQEDSSNLAPFLNFSSHLNEELPELLNSKAAFIDAHTNMGFCLLNQSKSLEAYDYLMTALSLDQYNKDILVNVGNALRQIGKRNEAIEMAWKVILLKHKESNPSFSIPEALVHEGVGLSSADNIEKDKEFPLIEEINFVCVKWGTLYGADYVNKLYNGVSRNFSKPYKFYCLTENPEGLDPKIFVLKLKTDFHTWWTKAHLFQGFEELDGHRNIYIDLDVIIVGSIDFLANGASNFALLKSDEIECEKNNKEGYNSSLIAFRGNHCKKIYQVLEKYYPSVTQVIFRFDYWLEMLMPNAEFLQDLHPGKISDYLTECQQEVKEGTAIVVFPRKPKPHDYPSAWIKDFWI